MKKLTLLLVCALLSCTSMSRADMGSIPYTRDELWKIYEPFQDAIIGWNGDREVIYLQTQLQSTTEGKVLELMPLPSRPTVTKAEPGIFLRAAHLVPEMKKKPVELKRKGGFFGSEPDPGVVHERVKLGAHDIFVVEALAEERFTEWVAEHLKKAGAEAQAAPPQLDQVVREYIRDGYRWFLFDVVTVYPAVREKEPLRIEFDSAELYFPMRITRTESGATEVNLTILTTMLFEPKHAAGIPAKQIKQMAPIRRIQADHIKFLEPALWRSLGAPENAYIRGWRITGELNSFTKDVRVRRP